MNQLQTLLWNAFTIALFVVSVVGFLSRSASFLRNANHQNFNDVSFSSQFHQRRLQQTTRDNALPPPIKIRQQRLLYIVTSIHEFDIGRRETIKGYDRFTNTLVPVIRESIASILQEGIFQPDVYVIAQYNISEYRYGQLRSILPETVGLEVWSEATPIYYMQEYDDTDHIQLHTRGLARQHRYVIKDKIFSYDVFVNFEDDMLIRGPHIAHFVNLTNDIYHWRRIAQQQQQQQHQKHAIGGLSVEAAKEQFYGEMTMQQLARTIPGFLRVEVALSNFTPVRKNKFQQIPVRYDYYYHQENDANHTGVEQQELQQYLDPSICCHVRAFNGRVPAAPPIHDLCFWETSIDALGVRRMPNDEDWVLVLGGSNNEIWDLPEYVVGDFWSGRAGDYFHNQPRPDRKKGRYMSNQGGWMATRRQIKEWHERWCRGGFLPPYDPPHYNYDGLDLRSVEYWSGGIQLVGVNSCNLQRVVSLDPHGFSRSLLYHTSNNKQRSPLVRPQFSGRNIQEFWGQLVTVKHAADAMID